MISFERALGLLFALAAITAAPLVAQTHDGSVGYGGGFITFTDFNSGGGGAALALDAGWVATAHIEHWPNRGRIGGRANVAFTRRPMETADDVRSIHTWIVGGDLLLRLVSPSSRPGVAPFLAAGAGVVSYGLGDGGPIILGAEEARYPGNTDRRFTVSGGLGFDLFPDLTIFRTPTALRIEAVDHVALDSPFTPLGEGSFDPVHNIRVTVSLLGLVHLTR